MKVMRKMEVLVNGGQGGFKVGDQIPIGKYYTATCQKVGKNGAIFMFDQLLDYFEVMNQRLTNGGGYELSDLRVFFKTFAMNSMFDEVREFMVPFKKTGDFLRIPTAEEMFGPEEIHNSVETLSHKKQWPLMKDRLNRIGFRGEDQEISWYWLQNKIKESDTLFSSVNNLGYPYEAKASFTHGVRVVFRLLI